MKKTLMTLVAVLLTVAMLLTLCACGESNTKRHSDDDDEDEDEDETAVTTTVGDEEEESPSTDDDESEIPIIGNTDREEQEESTPTVPDPDSIVSEWKGTIVLDDWLRAFVGAPTGTDAQVALLTKLYDVMIDDIALDYYMEFYEDGTAAWKMKETFVADMLDIVRNNMATYIADGGAYELLATQGLSREQADAALASQGMTAEEFGNSLLVSLESGLQSSVSAENVMPGGTVKDGFYIGLGQYEHEGDEVVFIGKDGSENRFAVNLEEGTMTAKAFYLGGVAVSLNLVRV